MNVHTKYMSLAEARKISQPLLVARLASYDFVEAEIIEDEGFDGEPVFRIDAKVGKKVPAEVIAQALADLHSALNAKGDERLVFLTTRLPQPLDPQAAEEDVD